ncbi:MAG: response regulator [Desulfohalobiaceae bacterium]
MNSPAKIILIDDDEQIRSMLQEFLQDQGYQIFLAEDGLLGMELLQKEKADLLILDIRLPYISGIGLVQIARNHSPDLPIICITGYGFSPEKIAEQEQADLILSKPFDLQRLLQAIKELLQ